MTITIILTDDWELRGNGCGTVSELQKIPAIKLMDLYDSLGIKSTFNVEVMQQLTFLKYSSKDNFLFQEKKDWEYTVNQFIERNFDVQLHIHPQWLNAERISGYWKLNKKWNIVDYSDSEIDFMFSESIKYLKSLNKKIELKSFRGGSWGLGPPSEKIQNKLQEFNINIDMSIANGLYYDGNAISLDYRNLESKNIPYFTNLYDVRKIGDSKILEIPTQSVSKKELIINLLIKSILNFNILLFKEFIFYFLFFTLPKKVLIFIGKLKQIKLKAKDDNLPDFVETDPFGLNSTRSKSPFMGPVIDLSSRYSFRVWKILIDCCIKRAQKINKNSDKELILIFENHTKGLQTDNDFKRIRKIILYIQKKYPQISFKTISQISNSVKKSIKNLENYENEASIMINLYKNV